MIVRGRKMRKRQIDSLFIITLFLFLALVPIEIEGFQILRRKNQILSFGTIMGIAVVLMVILHSWTSNILSTHNVLMISS
jgi:hypothetical protein